MHIKLNHLSFQDPKVIIDLEQKGTGGLEARTVTICSGLDFVNINYTPMIARDPETAKVPD
jgi:phosphatidylinositol phospholipase C beta